MRIRYRFISESYGILLACSVGLISCATPSSSKVGGYVPPAPSGDDPAIVEGRSFTGLSAESSAAIREIEREILEADADLRVESSTEFAKTERTPNQRSRPKIPIEINQRVRKWLHYFAVKDRERFHRFLRRGSQYKNLVQEILKENGVPRELYYLAMIESGYVTHAKSHASAVGPWQFIRGTGLRYGLRQNYYLDERKDIIRATGAAARYLKELHLVYNSWYLAMGSYNAGEGRILRAVLSAKTRDFWELVEKRALPPETRNYVPKFLAAAIIGRHPEKYGFFGIEAPSFPEVESAEISGGVRLSTLAKHIGVPFKTLKRLNPHLMRSMTPAGLKTYPVWVPDGKAARVAEVRSLLEKDRLRSRSVAARRAAKPGYHFVRRGQTLSSIAKRYGMSVPALKRLNGRTSNRIYAGTRLRVKGGVASRGRVRSSHHRVRRGQNLSWIAKRYGTSVASLKRINGLRSNRIYPGMRLKLSGRVIHRVMRGEALSVISARYGVPLSRIKRANRLRSNRIYVGQSLVIPR